MVLASEGQERGGKGVGQANKKKQNNKQEANEWGNRAHEQCRLATLLHQQHVAKVEAIVKVK